MRKYIVAIALLALGVGAKAQVENFDEVELLGSWNVTSSDGIFDGRLPIYHNTYRKPVAFTFNDNTYSTIKWEYAGPDYDWEQSPGYWVTHSSDKYILHILLKRDYSTGGDGISTLNFIVTAFDGGTMTLQTLAKDGAMQLSKEGSAGIRSTRSDATGGKAYRIDGTPAAESDKGIIIQDGKKSVQK